MTGPGKAVAPRRGRGPLAADVALAALLTAVSLPLLWTAAEDAAAELGYAGPSPTAVLLTLAMNLPLVWRRHAPLVVVVLIAIATTWGSWLGLPLLGFSVLVAVYTVVLHATRRHVVVAAVVVAATMATSLVAVDEVRSLPTNLLVLVAAGLFGDWQRLQRARAQELVHRHRDLERARERRAAIAVQEERQRIATELRDVMAHTVTAMITQARAAQRLLTRDRVRAADALVTVEETGTDALAELRRLVGLLRHGEGATEPPHEVAPPTATQRAAAPGSPIEGFDERGRREPDGVVEAAGQRWRGPLHTLPPAAQDAVLILVVLAAELSLQWLYTAEELALEEFGGPTPTSLLLVTAMVLCLALRRRSPQLVTAATLIASAAVVMLSFPAQLLAPLVALYTVASRRPRRVSAVWLGVGLVLATLLTVSQGALGFLPGQALVIAAAWLLGDRQQVSQRYRSQLEERSRRLEERRRHEVALAIADERARIARDLHDVVAHSIGVMIVQTRAARRMLARDPDRAAAAVAQIVTSGSESLGWLREILPADDAGGLAPQPGLDDLRRLVDDVGHAGPTVTLEIDAAVQPAPAIVGLSAYRIAQEALTNVLRHADASHAHVSVTRDGDELCLEVADDGRGPSGPGSSAATTAGHGLIGMAERARLVGGHVTTGARPGGGFTVAARLPMAGSTVDEPAAAEEVQV